MRIPEIGSIVLSRPHLRYPQLYQPLYWNDIWLYLWDGQLWIFCICICIYADVYVNVYMWMDMRCVCISISQSINHCVHKRLPLLCIYELFHSPLMFPIVNLILGKLVYHQLKWQKVENPFLTARSHLRLSEHRTDKPNLSKYDQSSVFISVLSLSSSFSNGSQYCGD